MRCVYLVIWLLSLFIEAKKYGFLLGTEGWSISGYGSVEHRPWSIYSSADGVSLSQFIIGKEERVNVDTRNRDDKDLWYFVSPPIVLDFRPTLLMFTMMSFSGDFRRLNRVPALVRLRFHDGVVAQFPVYQTYDGILKRFTVPFVEGLWTIDAPNSYDVSLHLCTFKTPTSWAVMSERGDADCAFTPFRIQNAQRVCHPATRDALSPFSLITAHEVGVLNEKRCKMRNDVKDRLYKCPFRLEILGDWTQGWETIGLDNVEII